MSENFETKIVAPVQAEEKGESSRLHQDSWGLKSATEQNALGQSAVANQSKIADTVLPSVNIVANEASNGELATGRGHHHHHHGGYYPYPGPVFHRPESHGQFQTNTGHADFRHLASNVELATGQGHHHHHGGFYPYPGPVFHRPESHGQFQTNTGHADFRHLTTGHHHGGFVPIQTGEISIPRPESHGQFQTNTGTADFERTGHHNAFHHPFGPGGYYPQPYEVTPWSKVSASGGDHTIVRSSQKL